MILNGIIIIYISLLIWYSNKHKFITFRQVTHAGAGAIILWMAPAFVESALGELAKDEAIGGFVLLSESIIHWISIIGGGVGLLGTTLIFFVSYYRHKKTLFISEEVFKKTLSDLLSKLPDEVEVSHRATAPGSANWKPLFAIDEIPEGCDREQVESIMEEVNRFILNTEVINDEEDGEFVA